jgi:hypothetical protein
MVRSNHRRSRRKLASSARIHGIYLDYKQLGSKGPCKWRGEAVNGSGEWSVGGKAT